MKWVRLRDKVLKCVGHFWVYMSKFVVQGADSVLDAFGEICLNQVFSVVVVRSIICCYSCDFDEKIIRNF